MPDEDDALTRNIQAARICQSLVFVAHEDDLRQTVGPQNEHRSESQLAVSG